MSSSALLAPCSQPKIGSAAEFREVMRCVPSTVALVTSRDNEGRPHGMAASAVISVSMEPASVLVAVNRTAGIHPVLMSSRRICLNFLGHEQQHLLEPFSRSDLRSRRFASADWHDVKAGSPDRLPWLPCAHAVVFGRIDQHLDYGTHTLFIALVDDVALAEPKVRQRQPLVWLGGRCASLALPS